ncbi:protocadherin gamma-C5-like [Dendropsophus ebraccatus]|uniref:protocadherin gamma-C5-like n=1 Tax=Dendropsophus ebraccatus TaxID=150705 RepID=UPI0038315EAA
MDIRSCKQCWKWQVLCFLLHYSWGWVSGQLRYSIVEESEPGTVVGNVAQDLGIRLSEISHRKLHLRSEDNKYFDLKQENGVLFVRGRIDRESLCDSKPDCSLYGEAIAENPVEIFSIEIEILDINDNSPLFSVTDQIIKITELLASPGARFALEIAEDLDVGVNGVSQYTLNTNPYFSLSVKNRKDGTLIPQLILEKVLDREEKAEHNLILTAIDGGEPARSGTCRITIVVLDINDNPPVFNQSLYKISIRENLPLKTVILTLNASDQDDGANGEIWFSFDGHTSKPARQMFGLNEHTGDIFVNELVDYEEFNFYELSIRAVDNGSPELEGSCIVQVEIEDVNDNSPDITFSYSLYDVPENAPLETVVGFVNVRDKDSGKNGEIKLDLSPNVPFRIKQRKKRYALVTDGSLDREETPQYTIELTASDLGSPPLYSKTGVTLRVSDINDNAPVFTQATYNAFIMENSDPGTLLCTVSATDLDEGVNSDLVYSIVESQIDGSSVSSFVYIHSNDGNIYAQRSFDYEQIQVLQITIKVEDSGSPQLSSTVPVFIFILDRNDNPPTLLYPEHSEDLIVQERIPKSTSAGYLVTKLSAVDLDSGHNAWLLFTLIDPINYSSFQVSKHTGEVRTVRGLQESQNMDQQLVISISDQGNPPLSTTVTVLVSIADEVVVERPKSGDFLTNSKPPSDMTLYLIISLVAISLVSLVTFMILLVRCLRKDSYDYTSSCCILGGSQSKPYTDQYQPALYLNTDGTLKYMEVRMVPPGSQGQSYQTHLPPAQEQPNSNFTRPLDFPQSEDLVNDARTSSEVQFLNNSDQLGLHWIYMTSSIKRIL